MHAAANCILICILMLCNDCNFFVSFSLHPGLGVDGLYRVSGNLAIIQKLRFAVNHGMHVHHFTALLMYITNYWGKKTFLCYYNPHKCR